MDGSEMGQTKKKFMAAMTFPPTKFAHHPRVDDEGREEKQGRENVAICDRRPWQHMRFTREDRNPLPTSAMSLDGEGEVSCYRRRFQVHHRQPSGFQLAGCYPLAAHHCRSLTAPSALFPRVSWQATPACGLSAGGREIARNDGSGGDAVCQCPFDKAIVRLDRAGTARLWRCKIKLSRAVCVMCVCVVMLGLLPCYVAMYSTSMMMGRRVMH